MSATAALVLQHHPQERQMPSCVVHMSQGRGGRERKMGKKGRGEEEDGRQGEKGGGEGKGRLRGRGMLGENEVQSSSVDTPWIAHFLTSL